MKETLRRFWAPFPFAASFEEEFANVGKPCRSVRRLPAPMHTDGGISMSGRLRFCVALAGSLFIVPILPCAFADPAPEKLIGFISRDDIKTKIDLSFGCFYWPQGSKAQDWDTYVFVVSNSNWINIGGTLMQLKREEPYKTGQDDDAQDSDERFVSDGVRVVLRTKVAGEGKFGTSYTGDLIVTTADGKKETIKVEGGCGD